MPQNNTTLDGAWALTIGSLQYTSGLVFTVAYTRNANGDLPGYTGRFRHAWWTYKPLSSGSNFSFSAVGSTYADVNTHLLRLEGDGSLTLMSTLTNNTGTNSSISVVGGTTYYLLQTAATDTDGSYWLIANGPATAKPAHDNRQNAQPVIIVDSGNTFHASPTPTNQLTYDDSTGLDDPAPTVPQTAWWKYDSAINGTVTFLPNRVGGSGGVAMWLYSSDRGSTTIQKFGTTYEAGGSGFAFTADTTKSYWVQMFNGSEGNTPTFRLSATGPRSLSPALVAAPIKVRIAVKAPSVAPPPVVAAPIKVKIAQVPPLAPVVQPAAIAAPIPVTVAMTAGVIPDVYAVPPITVRIALLMPSVVNASVFLSSPDHDEIVTSYYPQFMVGLTSGEDDDTVFEIEIQWANNPAFTTPSSAIVSAPQVDGGIFYTPTDPVFDYTYWRARLRLGGEVVTGWTAADTFEVQNYIAAGELPVTWLVDTDADRPIHLWHFEPDGVEEGDLVTAYGQGFPLSAGTLTLDGEPIAPQSWELVPASGAAHADRVIDADLVDPEHFAVTFIAPQVEEPGGPLIVEA